MFSHQFGIAHPSARRRIFALPLLFGIAVALAVPGSLDPGFGESGLLLVFVSCCEGEALDVIQQSDGKLILAGNADFNSGTNDFVAVRVVDDGTLDTPSVAVVMRSPISELRSNANMPPSCKLMGSSCWPDRSTRLEAQLISR